MPVTRTWTQVLDEHAKTTAALAPAAAVIEAIILDITAALRAGGKILLAGNGGSAADAQHIAAEFVGRFRLERRGLPAIALTTDTSILTAVGNDYAFERIFARQVEALASRGDVFWGLSTSGNSPNVVHAAKAARQRNLVVVGFVGESGGALVEHCQHVLRVPAKTSDRIQEGHQLAYHYICERVEAELAAE
jgi:D-sedoheptulose 7-phosphate isomerase